MTERKDVTAAPSNNARITRTLGRIDTVKPIPRPGRKRKRRSRDMVYRVSDTNVRQLACKALKTFTAYKDALEAGKSLSVAPRAIPDAMPDGSPVTNLDDLATIMGVHRKAAPFYVLEAKNASAELIAEAKREINPNKMKEGGRR